MRTVLACLVLSSGLVSAATLTFYSTGYSATGSKVTAGGRDGNWSLVSDPAGSVATPFAPYVTTGSVLGTFPFAANDWLKDGSFGSNSEWISPKALETSSDPSSTNVPYVYQQTFTVTALENPNSVVITGEWSADNYGYIVVNGTEVTSGEDGIIPNAAGEFRSFTSFILNSSNSDFVAGKNVVQFDVFNNANGSPDVTGINVDIESTDVDPAPEASTFGIVGLGLAAFGLLRRTANRRAALCQGK
jgi:hypothetical protein